MNYENISANDFIDLPLETKRNESFRVIRYYNKSTKTAEAWFAKILIKHYHLSSQCSNWSEFWFQNNKLHRLDGPALILTTGPEVWFKDGKQHREDGPAVIVHDSKAWWKDGKLHRTDGPAITGGIRKSQWYLENKWLTKESWFNKLTKEQLVIALANPENF